MREKKSEEIITFQRKVKVLKKLYGIGCRSEKELLSLTMLDILKVENISIQDIAIILEMQKRVKYHMLFSYLGGMEYHKNNVIEPSDNNS